MARIFVHIGAHKTGTSYLQSLFHRNRDRLQQAGIHYPLLGGEIGHHGLAARWIVNDDARTAAEQEGGADRLWDRLIAEYAYLPGTVFLSSEVLSRAAPDHVDMADLARLLAPFEECHIVYSVRGQAELLQSIWLQIARHREVQNLRHFLTRALDTRRASGLDLDYRYMYRALLDGFRPEQIHMINYDIARHAPGGIAQAVLSLMEAGIDADALIPPDVTQANISPNPLVYFIATQIMRRNHPPPELTTLVNRIVSPDPSVPTTLFRRYEYERIHDRFRFANMRLTKRVARSQPGFHFANPNPPETLLYRDDLLEQHWIDIASALYQQDMGDPPAIGINRMLGWMRNA